MALRIRLEGENRDWFGVAESLLRHAGHMVAQDAVADQDAAMTNAIGRIGYELSGALQPITEVYPMVMGLIGECIRQDPHIT